MLNSEAQHNGNVKRNSCEHNLRDNKHEHSSFLFFLNLFSSQVVVGSKFQQLSRRLGVTITTQVTMASDWSKQITCP